MLDKVKAFSLDLFSLKGKTAIITGGNSGLGQAYSIAFAKAGANVAVVAMVDDNGETQGLVEEFGGKYYFVQSDITKEGEANRVVNAIANHFGQIDILVNNAGICINEPDVLKFTRTQWDKMISVNLTAAFEMSHEVAKLMIPQKSGKIINIASMFSYLGGQWSPAYSASKHGIVGLTKAYCDELAQFNIQVTAIAPGYFATPMTEKTRSDPQANGKVLSHIPANRWGDIADLMGAAIFLASDASNYVNGSVIAVDGGFLVR
ncbi:SDR family oxidoreductase [Thorsellia kenyensis]|uniref:SDR family oxidoreductase n=1 Tax=Thorsellia kenyensis TaxID=1549888 RepID=A0ABV6C8A6_9GAMM